MLARARFRAQDAVARSPAMLRLSYALRRGRSDFLVDRDTDLLIEGFPRSANTFAAWAFMLTNPGQKLAHHVHTRAHVLMALRQGVPALILLREPEAAIRSFLVRRPEIPAPVAVRRYVAFHEGIAGRADELVFARFETVVNDFNRVVDAVNRGFGTAFEGFGPTVGKAEVFAAIDDANRRGHGGRINPRHVPRPHPDRDRLKENASLAGCERGLARAEKVYSRLSRGAV